VREFLMGALSKTLRSVARLLAGFVALGGLATASPAHAQGAFYIGGSVGDATIQVDVPDADDGTDPAYGIGARLKLEAFEIRAEYEYFDIDTAEEVYMLSAGVAWRF
jgi:hypothetical protein